VTLFCKITQIDRAMSTTTGGTDRSGWLDAVINDRHRDASPSSDENSSSENSLPHRSSVRFHINTRKAHLVKDSISEEYPLPRSPSRSPSRSHRRKKKQSIANPPPLLEDYHPIRSRSPSYTRTRKPSTKNHSLSGDTSDSSSHSTDDEHDKTRSTQISTLLRNEPTFSSPFHTKSGKLSTENNLLPSEDYPHTRSHSHTRTRKLAITNRSLSKETSDSYIHSADDDDDKNRSPRSHAPPLKDTSDSSSHSSHGDENLCSPKKIKQAIHHFTPLSRSRTKTRKPSAKNDSPSSDKYPRTDPFSCSNTRTKKIAAVNHYLSDDRSDSCSDGINGSDKICSPESYVQPTKHSTSPSYSDKKLRKPYAANNAPSSEDTSDQSSQGANGDIEPCFLTSSAHPMTSYTSRYIIKIPNAATVEDITAKFRCVDASLDSKVESNEHPADSYPLKGTVKRSSNDVIHSRKTEKKNITKLQDVNVSLASKIKRRKKHIFGLEDEKKNIESMLDLKLSHISELEKKLIKTCTSQRNKLETTTDVSEEKDRKTKEHVGEFATVSKENTEVGSSSVEIYGYCSKKKSICR